MPEDDLIKVLVVDDDALQLDLTARQLRLENFNVEVTSTSFGVSNLVRNFKPHVVLLDVQIPALSGDRLLELARPHAPKGTRFVLYSACDEARLRALAAKVAADGWISKNVTAAELAGRIRALVA
jgi:DNA-binding response OmpR family regulator